MQFYPNRYQAQKAKKKNPYARGSDVIVKVSGGYTIMTTTEYLYWKKQK